MNKKGIVINPHQKTGSSVIYKYTQFTDSGWYREIPVKRPMSILKLSIIEIVRLICSILGHKLIISYAQPYNGPFRYKAT